MSLEEPQRPNSVDPPAVLPAKSTPSPKTEFFVHSPTESSEDLSRTHRSEEGCLVDATPHQQSAASKLKFSIHRILGFDDLPQTGSHLSTSGVSTLPRIFIRCLGDGDDRCDSSGRLTAEEEDDEEDDDAALEREVHQDLKTVARDGPGCEDKDPPHPLSTPFSVCSPSSQRLSWLQCTRYKPPKLPRTKKSKEGSKKRKLGRNPRVPFTQHQVAVLEQKFRHTHYLSSVDVAELSATLNLTENRVKIWFQNRRARERREKDGSPCLGDGGVSGGAGCHSSSWTSVVKNKSLSEVDVDLKLSPLDIKTLSRPANCTAVIPNLHAVMRAKAAGNDYLTLASSTAERYELRPYFSSTPIGGVPPTSSVAVFENRLTSYSATSWPTSVQGLRMPVAAADIFAQLSSSSMNRRISSAFGPISFLR